MNEVYSEAMQRDDRDQVIALLTRKGFQKRLTDLDARTDGGHHHVVAWIECDQFRAISSTCGIEALESLTKTLGDRLQKSLPKDCGGDVPRGHVCRPYAQLREADRFAHYAGARYQSGGLSL